MVWPTVLGIISYIAILCCLTFWFTRHHFRNSRLWEEKSQSENNDEPSKAVPGNHETGRG